MIKCLDKVPYFSISSSSLESMSASVEKESPLVNLYASLITLRGNFPAKIASNFLIISIYVISPNFVLTDITFKKIVGLNMLEVER